MRLNVMAQSVSVTSGNHAIDMPAWSPPYIISNIRSGNSTYYKINNTQAGHIKKITWGSRLAQW